MPDAMFPLVCLTTLYPPPVPILGQPNPVDDQTAFKIYLMGTGYGPANWRWHKVTRKASAEGGKKKKKKKKTRVKLWTLNENTINKLWEQRWCRRYSDYATGWTVRCSNPGSGKRFLSVFRSSRLCGDTQFYSRWIPGFFPGVMRTTRLRLAYDTNEQSCSSAPPSCLHGQEQPYTDTSAHERPC